MSILRPRVNITSRARHEPPTGDSLARGLIRRTPRSAGQWRPKRTDVTQYPSDSIRRPHGRSGPAEDQHDQTFRKEIPMPLKHPFDADIEVRLATLHHQFGW